jgi:DNA repair protein RAD16
MCVETFSSIFFFVCSLPKQAEKSTIALHKHHHELRDVWGDLAANIPIIAPTEAEQPANLKLTLLPFQRESLFWMKKQEAGIWNGGMLAVSFISVRRFALLMCNRMRWGRCPNPFTSPCSCFCRMGKTIQIIALFVSDNVKPNLVVA